MYRHPVTPCAPRPLQIYSSSSEGKALRSVHFRSINGPNRPQQSYLTDADGSPLPPHRKTAAVISVWASAAPSPAPDHEAAGSYLTPPPAGPLWTSGLERDEKKTKGFLFFFLLSVWISLHEYIYLFACECIHESTARLSPLLRALTLCCSPFTWQVSFLPGSSLMIARFWFQWHQFTSSTLI